MRRALLLLLLLLIVLTLGPLACAQPAEDYPDAQTVREAAHRDYDGGIGSVTYHRAERPGEWWVEVRRAGRVEWYHARREGSRWAVLPRRRAERVWWAGRLAGRARPR